MRPYVRARNTQVAQNAEIQALMQILNLDTAQPSVQRDKLRYGHVMLMTDQVRLPPPACARPIHSNAGPWSSGLRMGC